MSNFNSQAISLPHVIIYFSIYSILAKMLLSLKLPNLWTLKILIGQKKVQIVVDYFYGVIKNTLHYVHSSTLPLIHLMAHTHTNPTLYSLLASFLSLSYLSLSFSLYLFFPLSLFPSYLQKFDPAYDFYPP